MLTLLKKKWVWIILAVIVLAVAGGGYYYYTTQAASAKAATATEAAMQTTVARRGDLVVSANGSGTVAAATQLSLGFDESGTLLELNVGLGDTVKAGDVLARLQTDNTQEEIDASVAEAELAVVDAQRAIDDLKASAVEDRNTAMNNVSTYAQAVRDAQYNLENYSMPLFLQGLDTMDAVDQTKTALDAASAAFAPYKYYPQSNDTREALLEDLNEAQSNYDAAIKRLNYEYTLQVAQTNLDKARREYDQYKDGPPADDMAQSQAELANAQAKLALAKKSKVVVDLTAPMDGVVMAIDANVGEAVGASAILTLANLNHLQIEVYLDESDLDKAKAGNEAEVVFDALPDQTFKGKVITVSPGLETVDNVQAVKVIVQLDDSATANLLVGLTASVDIIAGRASGAVLVPVEALRELDSGEYGLFVVENGEPVFRSVEVGLQDVTTAEIVSGLQAGETVSTGITQTK